MQERFDDLVDSGEIVNTKSMLALDEDIYCKQCKHQFTLAEGNWEGTHPNFPGVKAIGLKCPACERVNVAYYKTNTMSKLEARISRVEGKARDDAVAKYTREFMRVQKQYGKI